MLALGGGSANYMDLREMVSIPFPDLSPEFRPEFRLGRSRAGAGERVMDEDFVPWRSFTAGARGTRPFAKSTKERGTHCVGDASEIESMGHPPASCMSSKMHKLFLGIPAGLNH